MIPKALHVHVKTAVKFCLPRASFSARMMGTFASAQSVLFKPGQTWSDILVSA